MPKLDRARSVIDTVLAVASLLLLTHILIAAVEVSEKKAAIRRVEREARMIYDAFSPIEGRSYSVRALSMALCLQPSVFNLNTYVFTDGDAMINKKRLAFEAIHVEQKMIKEAESTQVT